MFPKLKKLFSKIARPERVPLLSPPSPVQKTHPAPASAAPVGLPIPQSSPADVPSSSSDSITISLESVINRLPAALRSHVGDSGRAHVSILVPIKRISEQLLRGTVKISFGELKQASPIGTFIRSTSEDGTSIELPMQEIIPRLNSSYLARRAGQRQIEVPDDVFPVFGPKGQTLLPSPNRATGKSLIIPPSIALPLLPVSTNPSAIVAGIQQSDVRLSVAEASSVAPSATISADTSVADEQSARILSPKATIASSSDGREDSQEDGVFTIKLQSIASGWPLNVRQEITQASLFHLSVELPALEIETAMKRGKAVFTWKQIRTRIKSAIPLKSSPNDETQLELSLAAIVPLFLARKKGGKPRKSVSGGEHIPDIFTSSASGPSPTPIAFTPPTDVSLPDFDEPSTPPENALESSKSTELPKNDLGRIFGHPEKQNWTPVEIVQKTSALTGTAGAVITLQDGLLVAGELPPGQKTETFAAFLPQIFSKIDQYTAEMKLGKISEISVVVDKIPLQIFKTGKVFFGILGRSGQLLPMAKLSAIAVELGRPTT
jgi:predicted regulator of Ras-like GTPase activity (Roadblock/LC7/MglB family)